MSDESISYADSAPQSSASILTLNTEATFSAFVTPSSQADMAPIPRFKRQKLKSSLNRLSARPAGASRAATSAATTTTTSSEISDLEYPTNGTTTTTTTVAATSADPQRENDDNLSSPSVWEVSGYLGYLPQLPKLPTSLVKFLDTENHVINSSKPIDETFNESQIMAMQNSYSCQARMIKRASGHSPGDDIGLDDVRAASLPSSTDIQGRPTLLSELFGDSDDEQQWVQWEETDEEAAKAAVEDELLDRVFGEYQDLEEVLGEEIGNVLEDEDELEVVADVEAVLAAEKKKELEKLRINIEKNMSESEVKAVLLPDGSIVGYYEQSGDPITFDKKGNIFRKPPPGEGIGNLEAYPIGSEEEAELLGNIYRQEELENMIKCGIQLPVKQNENFTIDYPPSTNSAETQTQAYGIKRPFDQATLENEPEPLCEEGQIPEDFYLPEDESYDPGEVLQAEESDEGEQLEEEDISAPNDPFKLFFYSINWNDTETVIALRSGGFDVNAKDQEGKTGLMGACLLGSTNMIRILLEYPETDVNARDPQGNTALMLTCAYGLLDPVIELMSHEKIDLEVQNENGHTALMEAASGGYVDIVNYLVSHGSNISIHSNEYKETALTLAAYKGHLEVVRVLIAAITNYETIPEELHTALMEASMDGHVDVAQLLIDKGAMVNMPPDNFESPLTLAACGGHVELAMLLLKRGANLEEVNDEGYNALMEASREGHEEMVALLLTQGAKPNVLTEESKETALCMAASVGNLEVVKLLLLKGADVNLGASTPLMEASAEGHVDIVALLLRSNAKINLVNSQGDTALSLACDIGNLEVVKLLLSYKADVNHGNKEGRTPLMKAAYNGHLDTVSMLVHSGARVNQTTHCNDHTALSLACTTGHKQVVELLLLSGADDKHRLKDNSAMLLEAARCGHKEIVQMLLDWDKCHSSCEPVQPPNLHAKGELLPSMKQLPPEQHPAAVKKLPPVKVSPKQKNSKPQKNTKSKPNEPKPAVEEAAVITNCKGVGNLQNGKLVPSGPAFDYLKGRELSSLPYSCQNVDELVDDVKEEDVDGEEIDYDDIEDEVTNDPKELAKKEFTSKNMTRLVRLKKAQHDEMTRLMCRQAQMSARMARISQNSLFAPMSSVFFDKLTELKNQKRTARKATAEDGGKDATASSIWLTDFAKRIVKENAKKEKGGPKELVFPTDEATLKKIAVIYALPQSPRDYILNSRNGNSPYIYISNHIVSSIFCILFRYYFMPNVRQTMLSDDTILDDLYSEMFAMIKNQILKSSQVDWLKDRFQLIKELSQKRFYDFENMTEDDENSLVDHTMMKAFRSKVNVEDYDLIVPGYVLFKYLTVYDLKLPHPMPPTKLGALGEHFSKVVHFRSHCNVINNAQNIDLPVVELFRGPEPPSEEDNLDTLWPLYSRAYMMKRPIYKTVVKMVDGPQDLSQQKGNPSIVGSSSTITNEQAVLEQQAVPPTAATETVANAANPVVGSVADDPDAAETKIRPEKRKRIIGYDYSEMQLPINPNQLIFGMVGNQMVPLTYLNDTLFEIFKKMALSFFFANQADLNHNLKLMPPELRKLIVLPDINLATVAKNNMYMNDDELSMTSSQEDLSLLMSSEQQNIGDNLAEFVAESEAPNNAEVVVGEADEAETLEKKPASTVPKNFDLSDSITRESFCRAFPELAHLRQDELQLGPSQSTSTTTDKKEIAPLKPLDLSDRYDENNVKMQHLANEIFKVAEKKGGSLLVPTSNIQSIAMHLQSFAAQPRHMLPYVKPNEMEMIFDLLNLPMPGSEEFSPCDEVEYFPSNVADVVLSGDDEDYEYEEDEEEEDGGGGGEVAEEGEGNEHQEEQTADSDPAAAADQSSRKRKSEVASASLPERRPEDEMTKYNHMTEEELRNELLKEKAILEAGGFLKEGRKIANPVRKLAAASKDNIGKLKSVETMSGPGPVLSVNTNTTSTATTVSAGTVRKTADQPPGKSLPPEQLKKSYTSSSAGKSGQNATAAAGSTKGKQVTKSKGGSTGAGNHPPPAPNGPLDVNMQTDSNHDTALTLACAGGHVEVASLLLDQQANVELRDKKGLTPLMIAATHGHDKVVNMLCTRGANIEAQTERTKDTALSLACSSGRLEAVQALLAKAANKEHRNVSDYTPLSLAASGGYVSIIKCLLSAGSEINSRTGSKLGISPLMLAAMNGHTDAARLLLDRGSDINAYIETNRNTALTLACFQGRTEVVKLLLERNALIEHRAKTGLTPLMEAASGGFQDVGEVLIEKGADVNAQPVPSSRDTALTIAAEKGHASFVELLLNHNACIDVKNKKGYSPMWLACNGGHFEVVQLLVNAKCDCDTQDNRKISCLMAAVKKGHLKVVKFLVKHVNQLPSDQEIDRCLAVLSADPELMKKANACIDIIQQAKEKQAAEANKYAELLLGEIDQEKTREESRKAAAARRRERRKQKKKGGKGDDDKKDDDFDEVTPSIDDDDDVASEGELDDEENQVSAKKYMGEASINEIMAQFEEPAAVTSKNDKKKNKKKAKKNKAKEKARSETPPPPTPASVTTAAPVASTASVDTKTMTTKKGKTVESLPTATTTDEKETKSKKVEPTAKQEVLSEGATKGSSATLTSTNNSSSSVVPSSNTNSKQETTTTAKASTTNKMIEKTSTTTTTTSAAATTAVASASGDNSQQKREEGWKEVSRKSKKVSVPANVISRVIGRGGCNINQIREWSGAHIEVEKQKGQNDRMITIRGSADATRIAHIMITALAESDQELEELIPSLGLENLIGTSISGASSVFTPPTIASPTTSVSPSSDTATIDSFTPSTTPSISTTPITTVAPTTTAPRSSRATAATNNKPSSSVTMATSICKSTSSTSVPTISKASFAGNKFTTVESNSRGHHHPSNASSYNMVVNSKNRHNAPSAHQQQHNQPDKSSFANANTKHSPGKIASAVFKPTKQLQLNVSNSGQQQQQSLSRSQHSLSNTSPSTTCSTTSTTSKEVDKSELDMLSASNLSQKSMMFSTSSAASTGSASSSECNPVDFVQYNNNNNNNSGASSTSVWSKTMPAADKMIGVSQQPQQSIISSSTMFPTLPTKVEVVDESKAPGYKRHFTSPGLGGQASVMSSINSNSSAAAAATPFNGVASLSSLSVNTGGPAVVAGSSSSSSMQPSVVNPIGGPNVRSAPCTPPITSSAFNRAALNKFGSPQHNMPDSQHLGLDSLGGQKSNTDYLAHGGDIFSNMSSVMPSAMGLNNGMHSSSSATSGSLFYSDDNSVKYNNSNQMFYGNSSASGNSGGNTLRSIGNFGDPSPVSSGFYGGSGVDVIGSGNASKTNSMRATVNVLSDFGSSSSNTPRMPGHNNNSSAAMLGAGGQYNSSNTNNNNGSMSSRQYISGTTPAIANPMVRSAILNYSMNVFQSNVPKQYQEAAARLSHMSSQNSNFVSGNEFGAGGAGGFGSNNGNTSTNVDRANAEKLRMMQQQQYAMGQTRSGNSGTVNNMSSLGGGNAFQSNVNHPQQQQQQQSSNFYGLSKTSSNFSTLSDMPLNSHNANGSFLMDNAFADDEALNCLRAAIKQLPAPIGTERAQQRNLSKTPLSQQQPHHSLGSMMSPASNRLEKNSLLQESSLWGNDVNLDLLHPSTSSSSAANTSVSDLGGSGYSFNALGISDFSSSAHDLLGDSFEPNSLDFTMWPRQSSRFDDSLDSLVGASSSSVGFGTSNSSSSNNTLGNTFNGDMAFNMPTFSSLNKINLPTDSVDADSVNRANPVGSKMPQWSNWN